MSSWRVVFVFIFFSLFVHHATHAFNERRAFRLLERQDYEKLREDIIEALEQHEPVPAAHFFYAKLYIEPHYNSYNLDSAYHHITQAIDELKFTEPRTLEKFTRLDMSPAAMRQLKDSIVHLAYDYYKSCQTLEGYEYFMDHFDAPELSRQMTHSRDSLAYAFAEAKDTYAAYNAFVQRYPGAQQVPGAQKRYEKLLFQSQTQSATLSSYERFLKMHPATPYKAQIINEIFKLITLPHTPASYHQFLQQYPNSPLQVKALSRYHYSQAGPAITLPDSLQKVYAWDSVAIMPFIKEGQIGWMDHNGQTVIAARYDSIPKKFKCTPASPDILAGYYQDTMEIFTKSQHKLYKGIIQEVKDFGAGVLQLTTPEGEKYLLKNGDTLTPKPVQAGALINNQYLALKQNHRWGLQSISGIALMPFAYDTVYGIGQFIIGQQDDHYSILTSKEFQEMAANDNLSYSSWPVDEVELIDDHNLLMIKGDREALMDTSLQVKIPMLKHTIYQTGKGWLSKSQNRYAYFDTTYTPFLDVTAQEFIENQAFIAFKDTTHGWQVYDDARFTRYDSVQVLGERYAIFYTDSTQQVAFAGDTTLTFPRTGQVKLLTAGDIHWLQVNRGEDTTLLFSSSGDKVFTTTTYKVKALVDTSRLIVYNEEGQTLINLQGEQRLPVYYQAMVKDPDSPAFHLLKEQYFGYYRLSDSLYLAPAYEKKVAPFKQYLFIASYDGALGLVDSTGNNITPFQFKTINPWGDSTLLGETGQKWVVYNYNTDSVVYDQVRLINKTFESQGARFLVFHANKGMGVLSSQRGEVIAPGFSDIWVLFENQQPVFIGEKFVKEADLHIMVYYNHHGQRIKRMALTPEAYQKLYCGE